MPLGRERPTTATVFAAERLFTSMDADVGLQITVFGESFLAHFAFEGLLT
jgi:hypothetical protein